MPGRLIGLRGQASPSSASPSTTNIVVDDRRMRSPRARLSRARTLQRPRARTGENLDAIVRLRMLQALLVTFREGIESFLIVGMLIASLKKSQRPGLVRGVKLGLAISLVSCTAGAWLWLQVPNQPLYEGIAALTAALVVGLLLVQMLRAGRHMRAEIEAHVDRMTGQADPGVTPSARAIAGVALVTALLVTREGLEAVFFLGVRALALRAAEVRSQAVLVVVGAVLGLISVRRSSPGGGRATGGA